MPILNTPDFIFNNALDFFKIGKQRTKEIFQDDPFNNPYLWYHISAPAVNLAFSLELMLKTILLIEKGIIQEDDKQHRLLKLFQRITPESKSAIFKNFESEESKKIKYPALRFSKVKNVENKKNKSLTTEETILKIISIHDSSFISWRYSFELSDLENKMEVLEFNFGDMIRVIEATAIYLKYKIEKL